MTKLTTLRSQLASLRQARALVRGATAYSALLTAILWSLAGIFLLDLLFELEILPRLVVLLIAAGAIAWAAYRYTRPLLGVAETDEDMALLVERQQEIDSDLVAALQFESPAAATWGSPQLEDAVIDYVANVGPGINVFEGFSRQQMVRRGTILGITAAVFLITVFLLPGHALAFFNRLLLGSMHYPTNTVIEQVIVNRQSVLVRSEHGSRPLGVKCAEARPISFLIHCGGDLPKNGEVRLTSTGPSRSKTNVDLRALTLDERLARLKFAQQRVAEAQKNNEIDISQPWRDEIAEAMRFDAPAATHSLYQLKTRGELAKVAAEIESTTKAWPGNAASSAVYTGELPRLLDDVRYKLFLGDAWTDAAAIAMIPLPIVEPVLTPLPPEYARTVQAAVPSGQRQLAVVEGSAVKIAIDCTNKKTLKAAWLLLKTPTTVDRFELAKQDSAGYRWELAGKTTPLDRVTAELRYEIQVIDIDGLSLETPIRGSIRIKPDRPPVGSAELVHKVVLPTAEPVVEYRATDDYGLSAVRLLLEVERQSESRVEATPQTDGTETATGPAPLVAAEVTAIELLPAGTIVEAARLPLQRRHALLLTPLKLAKGDRVKVTLETVDYRGKNKQSETLGESHKSEPLILEISDESGVLAAISAADERSEQRLTDIIKRQLGIGESP